MVWNKWICGSLCILWTIGFLELVSNNYTITVSTTFYFIVWYNDWVLLRVDCRGHQGCIQGGHKPCHPHSSRDRRWWSVSDLCYAAAARERTARTVKRRRTTLPALILRPTWPSWTWCSPPPTWWTSAATSSSAAIPHSHTPALHYIHLIKCTFNKHLLTILLYFSYRNMKRKSNK